MQKLTIELDDVTFADLEIIAFDCAETAEQLAARVLRRWVLKPSTVPPDLPVGGTGIRGPGSLRDQ